MYRRTRLNTASLADLTKMLRAWISIYPDGVTNAQYKAAILCIYGAFTRLSLGDNCILQAAKAPPESQAQCVSLNTSAEVIILRAPELILRTFLLLLPPSLLLPHLHLLLLLPHSLVLLIVLFLCFLFFFFPILFFFILVLFHLLLVLVLLFLYFFLSEFNYKINLNVHCLFSDRIMVSTLHRIFMDELLGRDPSPLVGLNDCYNINYFNVLV